MSERLPLNSLVNPNCHPLISRWLSLPLKSNGLTIWVDVRLARSPFRYRRIVFPNSYRRKTDRFSVVRRATVSEIRLIPIFWNGENYSLGKCCTWFSKFNLNKCRSSVNAGVGLDQGGIESDPGSKEGTLVERIPDFMEIMFSKVAKAPDEANRESPDLKAH